jgi:PAB-dependent poly(A)-specific ribonuclease subunit 2
MDDTATPLTSVPFPLEHSSSLLSDWPEQFTRRRFRKVPPIDHAILSNMRMVGTIGYAPSPAGHRPNQVAYATEKRTQRGQKHSGADSTHSKGWSKLTPHFVVFTIFQLILLQKILNAIKCGNGIVTLR